MGKMPAFQFYPSDWRSDNGVQALGFFERGVWFEMLCLMHESEQRGRLLLNGNPMPEDALARLLGLDNQILTNTISKLLDYGVASRDQEGALISRRMIRDEYIRQIRKEEGKKGGNPNLVNQKSTKPPTKKEFEDNQKSTPSSSSSSSSSKQKKDAAFAACVSEVFEEWKQVLNHPSAQLDLKRKKRISAMLEEGFSVSDLKTSLKGVLKSPFHLGHNSTNTRYDGIETIFRDRAQVEKFIDLTVNEKDKEVITSTSGIDYQVEAEKMRAKSHRHRAAN